MTLVKDGFPRITSEGLEILKEGLNGDFSRWIDKKTATLDAWGII